MKTSWFSRAAAVALVAAASLLAACGSGSTVQQLTPTRFMAVGDGMIDLGHDGNDTRIYGHIFRNPTKYMKIFSIKETTDNSFEALKIFGNSLPY